METNKEARVAILIADKIDLKTKTINKRQRGTLYNDKRMNPTRGPKPSKHLCTQCKGT